MNFTPPFERPFAADGAAAIGVEGVTTAGAAWSGRLNFVIILATRSLGARAV